MRATRLCVAVAMLASAGGAAGQASPFSGTWDVTWDMGLRTEGARVLEVTRRGRAVLVLERRGDSLSGTWTVPALEESHRLVGEVSGDEIRLTAPGATIPDGGRRIPVSMRWEGRLDEDGRLIGSMYLTLRPGETPPRRWEGVRRDGG